MIRKAALLFGLIVLSKMMFGQGDPMEEYFYESGKIKVVIAVASIVLAGIFIYLFMLDRKLTRVEKELKSKKA